MNRRGFLAAVTSLLFVRNIKTHPCLKIGGEYRPLRYSGCIAILRSPEQFTEVKYVQYRVIGRGYA